MVSIYFYLIIVFYLLGTYLGLVGNMKIGDTIIILPFIICVTLFSKKTKDQNKESKSWTGLLYILIIFSLLFGVIRTNLFLNNHQSTLVNHIDEKISFSGVVDDEPDKRENLTIYRVYIPEYKERIRIFAPHFPEYKYGNKVEIYGKLDKPDNFTNENGIEFNYISFLQKDDIYTTMYYPKITLQDSGSEAGTTDGNTSPNSHTVSLNPFQGLSEQVPKYLFATKQWLIENMKRWLPSPHAPLAAGLILGAKQSLGKELLDQFRRVGLIHIVVLSGYNVTIIANTIRRILGFLPRTLSYSLSFVAIIFFAIMTGASSTIVRASVMAGIVLVADYFNRRYAVNRALFLAAVVMVYLNPRILSYDPGFQLSFVATFALIHLGERLEKVLKFLPEKFGIREITSATLATQVAVMPMLIMMTGDISVVSLLVNLLVLPTVPLAMLFGFIPSLVFFNIGILGSMIALPAYLLLSYEIWIVEVFAKLPFATYAF